MEVLIQENAIIIVKGFNNPQTGKKIFFTYGFKEQIVSARDLNPESIPLDKDSYLIEISNKAQVLQWVNQGRVKVYGDVEELKHILLESN